MFWLVFIFILQGDPLPLYWARRRVGRGRGRSGAGRTALNVWHLRSDRPSSPLSTLDCIHSSTSDYVCAPTPRRTVMLCHPRRFPSWPASFSGREGFGSCWAHNPGVMSLWALRRLKRSECRPFQRVTTVFDGMFFWREGSRALRGGRGGDLDQASNRPRESERVALGFITSPCLPGVTRSPNFAKRGEDEGDTGAGGGREGENGAGGGRGRYYGTLVHDVESL